MDNNEIVIEIERLHDDSAEELAADAVCPCGCGMTSCSVCIA
jgi:hypothetical protein